MLFLLHIVFCMICVAYFVMHNLYLHFFFQSYNIDYVLYSLCFIFELHSFAESVVTHNFCCIMFAAYFVLDFFLFHIVSCKCHVYILNGICCAPYFVLLILCCISCASYCVLHILCYILGAANSVMHIFLCRVCIAFLILQYLSWTFQVPPVHTTEGMALSTLVGNF